MVSQTPLTCSQGPPCEPWIQPSIPGEGAVYIATAQLALDLSSFLGGSWVCPQVSMPQPAGRTLRHPGTGLRVIIEVRQKQQLVTHHRKSKHVIFSSTAQYRVALTKPAPLGAEALPDHVPQELHPTLNVAAALSFEKAIVTGKKGIWQHCRPVPSPAHHLHTHRLCIGPPASIRPCVQLRGEGTARTISKLTHK